VLYAFYFFVFTQTYDVEAGMDNLDSHALDDAGATGFVDALTD